ncbi:MAG: acylcoa--acetate/3-ketoacidcoatransferase [Firmicutes bacterium]|nr:acylcoa--acetate/3-ketoacidcoatransferase [Bacillota bacterium]
MAAIITKEQAAELFFDGAVVCGVSSGVEGWPEEIGMAVEKRFLETGHPAGMTNIHAAGFISGECWAHEGLLALNISSHESTTPSLAKLIQEDKLPAWYMPLGTMLQMYTEIGRGMPGVLSKCGLGTFMDARVDGGVLNPSAEAIDRAKKERGERLFIEYVPDFMGEEYLFYNIPKIDIGIMRGTTADEHGNITTEFECLNLELGAVARATKACGGIVIVEVERIAKAGSLNPKLVKIGQNLVDYIVVNEHPELITRGLNYRNYKGIRYWDGQNGQLKVPTDSIPVMPFDPKKVIIRRTIMELPKRGSKCNFGIGLPTFCGEVIVEQGEMENYVMISELGSVGGVPGAGTDFGCHWNNEWSCDHKDHFDWIDGTGLDFGVFGLSEAQEDGSINVSRLNGVTLGVGGFSNITTGAKKACFIGTFTAKGLKEHIEDGKLVIDQEGRLKKFVKQSEQIAFDAPKAAKNGKPALFITERAVLEAREDGVYLLEIAPGVDMQKDIFDQMGFEPKIPEEGVKFMPLEIFEEEWHGLTEILDRLEE